MSISSSDVTPKQTDRGAEVFTLNKVELLKQEDLLKPSADLLRPVTISLLATLWEATPCKKTWWQDETISTINILLIKSGIPYLSNRLAEQ